MLSGGEKQKVELVKTILKDADVYFFDEPTAHLDQESRDEYYQYLKKQKDKIIVVVSYNGSFTCAKLMEYAKGTPRRSRKRQ